MARKRMLDPKIWDSEQVMRLDPIGFKLYVYLISQADDEGRLAVCYQMMAARVYPFGGVGETEAEAMVKEMDKNGLIILYSVAEKEYIAHPNWTRYQKIDKPSKSTLPSPNGRRMVDERSSTVRRGVVPNRIEEKGIEEKVGGTAVGAVHKDCISHFFSLYESREKVKPEWGGKEGNLLKRDLARFGSDGVYLKKLMDLFFSQPPEFAAEAGLGYNVFHSQTDRLIRVLNGKPGATQAYPLCPFCGKATTGRRSGASGGKWLYTCPCGGSVEA